jgi:uncharacterized protein (DUF1800 family)
MDKDSAVALNRFGLGGRIDEAPPGDPRRWLTAQFDRFDPKPQPIAAAPNRTEVANDLADYLQEVRMLGAQSRQQRGVAPMNAQQPAALGKSQQMQARKDARQASRDFYLRMVAARTQAALITPAPFVERLVHFWANHFAISVDKLTDIGMGGLLEFEAVRPHVLGRFGDMLGAVERHPAMLLYLDQAQSIGPNSPLGTRVAARGNRKIGLNENLAREILELHTLGVRTGYSQEDVTEFARALTGWTVAGIARGPAQRLAGMDRTPGAFAFVPQLHEPGPRTIMGRSYGQADEAQANAVLTDLAVHPATAHHLATKLARHFTADDPPSALVKRLEAAFLSTGGDLPALYRVLIDAPEVWAAPGKFRTPWDWTVASLRAVGTRTIEGGPAANLLNQLGQPVWKPGSPAGFDDVDASWLGPDALMRRVEAAGRLAARAGGALDARTAGPKLAMLGPSTLQAVGRAESPADGLALMLVSPEFQRR